MPGQRGRRKRSAARGGASAFWLATLLLTGCLQADQGTLPASDSMEEAGPGVGDAVRFLAWGDAGHGNDAQYATSAAGLEVCRRDGCDVVLHLGDNIYEHGAFSADDPQFVEKFEAPYADWTLDGEEVPFLGVLGNHDTRLALPGVEPGWDNGAYQVAYHHRDDRPSTRFHMPARHYDHRVGDVHLFALDLTGQVEGRLGPVHQAPGALAAQQAWLEQALAASDARWKFAFSHYPYLSNGPHGDAGSYGGEPGSGEHVRAFVETAVCDRVDLYLASHDHTLQWLQAVEGCGRTEFVVSGAASDTYPLEDEDRNAAHFQMGDTLGFFWFEVAGHTLTGRAYDGAGELRFERVVERPAAR